MRIIVGDSSIKVKELSTQRDVSNLYGRSVRFDVFVTDSTGTEYNIEVQRETSGASGERARFNSAMLDARIVGKGFAWGKDHLPPIKVIFITEHDVFKHNKPLYHAARTVRELDNERFDDKAEIIYVNASYQDSSPLGRLIHDLYCNNPDDMYYKELANRAKYLKANNEGVSIMCEAMEKLTSDSFNRGHDKGRAEGREEGLKEGEEKTILRMFNKGKTLQDIEDAIDWTGEQINAFLRSRNLAPLQ